MNLIVVVQEKDWRSTIFSIDNCVELVVKALKYISCSKVSCALEMQSKIGIER